MMAPTTKTTRSGFFPTAASTSVISESLITMGHPTTIPMRHPVITEVRTVLTTRHQ
jgi:hypothetical protein